MRFVGFLLLLWTVFPAEAGLWNTLHLNFDQSMHEACDVKLSSFSKLSKNSQLKYESDPHARPEWAECLISYLSALTLPSANFTISGVPRSVLPVIGL